MPGCGVWDAGVGQTRLLQGDLAHCVAHGSALEKTCQSSPRETSSDRTGRKNIFYNSRCRPDLFQLLHEITGNVTHLAPVK